MSRGLHACPFFLLHPSLLNGRRNAHIVGLTLLLTSPVLGVPPNQFNGVSTALSTGRITLSGPVGIAVDAADSTCITDTGHHQIVQLNSQGTASVLTISGLSTTLTSPTGVAVDGSGTLCIADTGNNRVATVTAAGTGPVVSTPSIMLSSPQGVALDQSSNLDIADKGPSLKETRLLTRAQWTKPPLSERDIRTKFIIPVIQQAEEI